LSDLEDHGIDTTVEKHHDDGEVVERAREVDQRVVQVEHHVTPNPGKLYSFTEIGQQME